MSSTEYIQQLQERLKTWRGTLAHHLNQQAIIGSAHVPPATTHGISEARKEIARIKAALRKMGVSVDDLPDDVEYHDDPDDHLMGKERTMPATTAPNAINAQHSQGFVNNPYGPVTQHFGDVNIYGQGDKSPIFSPLPLPSHPQPVARNPFGHTGRIENPTDFFDREFILHRIFEELGKDQSLSLIGERQIGKSSLLEMVKAKGPQQLRLPPETFISIDMQIIRNEGEFFEALCEELGISPVCRGYKLERQLRGKRFILCLDEIEKMCKESFSGDEREELRSLADGESKPIKLVIASSISLFELFPDRPGETSPLANICPPIPVTPFSPPVARDFLIARLAGTGVSFNEHEIARLIDTTRGHPAHLQREAAEIYRSYTTPPDISLQ